MSACGYPFRDCLGLSSSSAKLVEMLANGESLAAAAGRLSLSTGSARQYIKRAFRKNRCEPPGRLDLQGARLSDVGTVSSVTDAVSAQRRRDSWEAARSVTTIKLVRS